MKYQILNTKYKILLLLIFNFLFLIFNLSEVKAAGVSLSINPPILEITAKPPAKITAPIKIKNLGEDTVQLQITLKPFTAANSEDGKVSYISPKRSYDEDFPILSKARIFDKNESVNALTLAPDQEKELTFYVEIDKNESLGDYYFSIIFLTENEPAEGNATSNTAGIATNILLSVGQKGQPAAEIKEFSAPGYIQNGPVPFTVKIANTGKQFITPKGFIIIKNLFGQRIGKVDLMPVNILAGTTRSIPDEDSIKEQLKSPSFNIQNSSFKPSALWREGFLLGPYTATLTMGVTDEGPVLNKKIYFFAFPGYGILVVLLTLVGILFIAKRIKRKLRG